MGDYMVYIHENKINGKVYVGMTKDPETRWGGSTGIQYKSYTNPNVPFWNEH